MKLLALGSSVLINRLLLRTGLTAALISGAQAQDVTPILRMDAAMHAARIEDVVSDVAGRLVLTASHDKSARLWSGEDGRLVQVLRPPFGDGNEGKLNAAALSPDARLAVVAGLTGYEWDQSVSVYGFDVMSGQLTRRFTGLPNVVFDLAFSATGRYLAAGLAGGDGIRVWDSATGKLTGTADGFGDNCHGLDWHGDELLVATCLDGHVRLFRVQGGRLVIKAAKEFPDARPFGVSIAPDGSSVAVGFMNRVEVKVLALPSLETILSPDVSGIGNGNLKAVRWSQDGERLQAAGHWDVAGGNPVRVWDKRGRKVTEDVSIPSNFIHSMSAAGPHGMVLSGGGPLWAMLKDGTVHMQMDPPQAQWEHTFGAFCCSADGTKISFAWSEDARSVGLFDLGERRLFPEVTEAELRGLTAATRRGLALQGWCSAANATERSRAIAQGLGKNDLGAADGSTNPQLGGKPLELVKHDISRSVCASMDGRSFVIGSDFRLTRRRSDGTQLWSVQPPDITWVVNEPSNGRIVLAGHGDGTIRWYRERDGQEILALFAHADRKRWVLWTPRGYFDCSPGAEDLIGWHVNRGGAQSADFFPVARFRAIYYRPDVIQRIPKTLDVSEALRQANTAMGKPGSRLDSIGEVIARLSPPVVEMESGNLLRTLEIPADAPGVTVRYRVRNTGRTKAYRVDLRLNGRPLDVTAPLPSPGESAEVNVPLPDGMEGDLAVIASHELASSEEALLRVRRSGRPVNARQPDLYVIAAGVSKLQANIGLDTDGDGQVSDAEFLKKFSKDGVILDDLNGADADAWRISRLFDAEQGRTFGRVSARVLVNAEATTAALRTALRDAGSRTRAGDLLLFSFSGHGYADDTHEFFVATHDVHPDRPTTTALTGKELVDLLAPIKARVVLLLDTCQAGAVLGRQEGGKAITGPEDLTGLVNTLSSAERGIVVLSSSSESELSFETEGGGYFTRAIVEGIQGKAAKDGAVTCVSLQDYITQRVPELVGGNSALRAEGRTQTPTVIMPKGVTDFVLAKP